MSGVVIVGGGQAGHQLAASLREGGYERPIALVEREEQLPYQRPPLSKDFLFSDEDMTDLAFFAVGQYAQQGIELYQGSRAARIDRDRREVLLGTGERLPYEILVLATGASARTLDVPGSTLDGVHTLRSLDDAQQLRSRLSRVGDVLVVGGGFIGLEFATGAAHQGHRVAVLERGSRILRRSMSRQTAEFLTGQHAMAGVRITAGASVSELIGRRGRVTEGRLRNGETLPADTVVVGIGVEPADQLARDAGLSVDNGIVVDEFLRTSDQSIFAIGDVARFRSGFAPEQVRVESVQNATDQARCVARTLTGDPTPYRDLPWFWSNQSGHLIQIAGIGTGHDAAYVRPSEDPLKFSTFCYRGDTLIAIESVGQPKIHMQARRLLRAGGSIPRDRICDPDLDLAEELGAHGEIAVR